MIFTSEAVSEGHPDKIADQISDAILDACLKINSKARVACEVFCSYKKIIISGEVSVHIPDEEVIKIARNVLKNIGYDSEDKYLDYKTFPIEVILNSQSAEISELVSHANEEENELGAGDQGIVYGYACNNLKTNYMPLAITIANDLVRTASKLRKENKFTLAYPDMKSQVSIELKEPLAPKIVKIAMSIQVAKDANFFETKKYVVQNIIKPVLKKYDLKLDNDEDAVITLFHLGGPKGDTGLTGRKIIADTYGGYSRHGGGAFSGKDATKVDRSGAYMARYVAKNLVAAGLLDECEIQIGYLIGYSKPVSIYIKSCGTLNTQKNVTKDAIIYIINKLFSFSPKHMIDKLNLNSPIFCKTTCYGHFGKPELPWEKIDMVKSINNELIEYLKLKK